MSAMRERHKCCVQPHSISQLYYCRLKDWEETPFDRVMYFNENKNHKSDWIGHAHAVLSICH